MRCRREIVPNAIGYFNIRLVILDANGCVSKRDISIMIEKSDIEISVAPGAKSGSR